MNVLSLFDGMSCAQIALNRIGAKVNMYFASEVDKYAIQVTQANFPNTVQLGCVTDIYAHDLPEIGLLVGGSPCQGFSFAGKQLNFLDERSKLFFHYVRLLNSVKPKYFLIENVKMKKEFQDVITNIVGVQPIEINSNLVSAQNRKRLYWTNIPNVTQPEDKGIMLKDIIQDGYVDRDKSFYIDRYYHKGGNLKGYCNKHRRQLVFYKPGYFKGYRKLTPVECERLQTVEDDYTKVKGVSNTQRYKLLGNGMTVDIVSHILSNMEVCDESN
jgi:site-specific DNA-cytosine methylase